MPALSIKEFYRFVVWTVAGLVCLGGGQVLAHYLLSHYAHAAGPRAMAVVAGTICYVPLIGLVGWLIRKSDEFERQVHLFGIAYGFMLAFFALVAIDLLRDAGFIRWSVWFPVPVIFLASWAVGLLVASREYRAPA